MSYNYYSIEEKNNIKYIRFLDYNLISIVQSYFPNVDLFRNALPAKNLLSVLNNLKKNYGSYFPGLINWIEEQYKDEIKIIRIITEKGFIEFDNLPLLFPIGQYVHSKYDGTIIGEKVTGAEIKVYAKSGNEYFEISIEAIGSDGCSLIRTSYTYTINFWKGLRKIDKLPVIPLLKEDEIYNKLVARGKKFVKYAIGYHFLKHSSKSSKGRIMVDVSRYKGKDTNNYTRRCTEGIEMDDDVKEEELFMCVSRLSAYSFVWKEWYLINAEHLNDISFDDEAFDKLVLDQTRKSLIESLVKFEYSKSDIISNKGDGCTFLLYGPPGVGKTLTAEAISEKLHRPLYTISIGELGTDAKDLEKELRKIFEMAHVWKAIILIDEVDIFLERRSAHEIKRNALVCVFLRLLDYHQGIVFLTTNRVNCLDDAFQTRISIFLEYKELDTKARETLWSIFLEFSDYAPDNVNIKKLNEKHYLNGREIKNIVKLAKALNKEKNELITTELLEKIINISSKKTLEKSVEETQSKGNKRKSGINDQDNQPNSKKIK
ncbi:P-loop containing nucleoside triphosphate hydrolase protein [Rhizophagus clarus]|uniref:P-loop containing nucleoside triphosphate hydrolase protein n=2 Tax=Rhizophagus clarus TaxID=94130 RepID=A0A8H3LFB3_9GLOM|nr:P-loop containing nucleoside triphosphate hydrolase protein [Rhizophagus clarus]